MMNKVLIFSPDYLNWIFSMKTRPLWNVVWPFLANKGVAVMVNSAAMSSYFEHVYKTKSAEVFLEKKLRLALGKKT